MRIAFLNPQGNFDRKDSFLTEHPDFGGQLIYVKELSLALARMGMHVDIVTRLIEDPDWPGFDTRVDHYDEEQSRVRIIRVPCGGPAFLEKERLWPHLPEFISNLVAFYGDEQPDYMTAHYADGGYCAALMQQATGLGFTFTGHSLGAQKLDKLHVNPDNVDELEQRYRFSRRIAAERLAMQRADTIITSTGQERFEQYGHTLYHGAVDPADDNLFQVTPPGVNTRIFDVDSSADDPEFLQQLDQRCAGHDLPHVLVSSRLDPKKNIGGVVEAYAHSSALQEKARLALFVRGVTNPFESIDALAEGERSVLGPILERIEQAGLREKVDFFDIRSQQNLAAAYRYFGRRGSVFVLPSLFEPFGLAPIEAAACGLAVVATKNGGPTEIFEDGSGLLVDPTDPADMSQGIERALAEHGRLAEAGRQRVLSTYTWDQTAGRYLRAIKRHVESPGREKGDGYRIADLDASELIRTYAAGPP